MYRSLASLAALSVFSLCAACGVPEGDVSFNPAEEDSAAVNAAIRGGSVERSHESVVGLMMGRGACSGSLIAPNLVLTAQHCVAHLNTRGVACGRTQFSRRRPVSQLRVTTATSVQSRGAKFYDVASIHTPGGSDAFCGRDIALVTLQESIPSSEATPKTPRVGSPVSSGETFTAVGYGLDGTGQSGTRRSRGNRTVSRRTARSIRFEGRNKTAHEIIGDTGVCKGDSGGAAIDSQGRVFGVASRVRPARDNRNCGKATYASVYSWRGWIRDVARQAANQGGYTAPGWVGGSSGGTDANDRSGTDDNSGTDGDSQDEPEPGTRDGSDSTPDTDNGGSDSSPDTGRQGGGYSSPDTGGQGTQRNRPTSCREISSCMRRCRTRQCQRDCYYSASRSAKQDYADLVRCYRAKCQRSRDANRCIWNNCKREAQQCAQ